MAYLIVRVRGKIDLKPQIKHTMKLLNLTRVNHATLIPETPSYLGMLYIIKDYVTWGTPEKSTVEKLLGSCGRLRGNKDLTPKFLKENTEYSTFKALAADICDNKVNFAALADIGVKPIFRLHPPLKGYEGTKRAFNAGGALGNRLEKIDKLVLKMLKVRP